MENYNTENQIFRIGIELETLLNLNEDEGKSFVKNTLFPLDYEISLGGIGIDCDNSVISNLNISGQTVSRNPSVKRHDISQRVIRGNLYKQISNKESVKNKNVGIKTTLNYGSKPCPKDLSTNSWVITHDSSVRMLQKKERYTRFYETVESAKATEDQHKALLGDLNSIEHIEYVSPIIDIEGDWEDFIKDSFATLVKSPMHFHNSATSNHIHFSCGEVFKNPENLYNICTFWWYFEPLFMHLVPKWRRNNEYCKTIHDIFKDDDSKTDLVSLFTRLKSYNEMTQLEAEIPDKRILKILRFFQGNPFESSSRYAALNLMNLKPKGIGTIEVRIKHGSNDPEELINYVKLFMKFFKAVIEKKTPASLYYNKDSIYKKDVRGEFYLAKGDEKIDIGLVWNLFEYLKDLIDDDPLIDYFKKKFCLFNTKGIVVESNSAQAQVRKQMEVDFGTDVQPSTNNTLDVELPADNDNMEEPDHEPQQPPVQQRNRMEMEGGAKDKLKVKEKKKAEAVKYHYIFSYGSNSKKQILERLNADVTPKSAFLENYVRIFAGESKRWNGGVASVHPKKGSRVYGAISRLTEEQLNILDTYEGGYTRKKKSITLNNDKKEKVKAWVYIKNDPTFVKMPSLAYMKAIRRTLDDTMNTERSDIIIRKVDEKKSIIPIGHYSCKTNRVHRDKK